MRGHSRGAEEAGFWTHHIVGKSPTSRRLGVHFLEIAAVFEPTSFGATALPRDVTRVVTELLCDSMSNAFGAETATTLSPGGFEVLLGFTFQALTAFSTRTR